MMAQKVLPNASHRHQQDSKIGSSFSIMNDFTPHPETLGTSQGPSPQRTSKAPASKAKLPRLRARATRPLHKRSSSLKAFSISKKIRIGMEDTNDTGSSIKLPTTNTLEDLELEDAIELLKKKFQRSPFCSLSQLKADDLLNQLEQIAIDEKKYRPLQSDTTSSTQDSQSNSGLVDLEYASDDTSVLPSTPRLVATIDDFASEEVDHTESRQCKAHICDDDCKSKPLFHSTYPGCLFATHLAADWRRHEETTKHWSQQAFMCVYCPVPPMATDLNPKCQFCHSSFTATVGAPTAHYLRCPPAQIRGRTFRRKDKLLAHIRNDHIHIANPSKAAAAGEFQNSNPNWPRNCGFCELSEHVFISWSERMEHIAQHFQDGAKIADWRLPLPVSRDCRPSGTSSHHLDNDDSDDDNVPHGGSGLSQRKFSGKKTASSSSQGDQRSSGSRSNVPSSSGQRRRSNNSEESLDLAQQQMSDSLGARRKTSPALERYLSDSEEPIPALQSQLDQLLSADFSKDPQTPMAAKITMNGSEKQYMADAVAKRARGVFQWADLVVQATRYYSYGLSPGQIIEMLKRVPEEVDDVCKHVPRKVASKNYCRDILRIFELLCLAKRRERMQDLRASSFHYEQFKDRNSERRKGTRQWFLQHENFRKCEDSSSSKLLWISANPGYGKSVLLSSLVDKFFKDDNNAQKDIAYAFSFASKGNGYSQTPLSWAAQNGHEGIVKLLLEANADVDYSKGDYYRQTELAEAINYMFHWYRTSTKCYVCLPDVSRTAINTDDLGWESAFRKCSWFTRGWTLQELIAPTSVEFFYRKSTRLGSKISLQQQIHEITGIPKSALQGAHLSQFSDKERFSWIQGHHTKAVEDKTYSLLGIFDVSILPIPGEGEPKAFDRLKDEFNRVKDEFDKMQKCIQELRITDPREDKKRIEQTKGGLLKDSHRWILEHSDFHQWCDDEQSRLLSIKGDPGKGKTMLLCGVINELSPFKRIRDEKAATLLSCFFCQATNERINNAEALLRGLIYLLIDQQPSLVSLQLYCSALLCPERSIVRRQFEKCIPLGSKESPKCKHYDRGLTVARGPL